jgi:hypothetical protein
MGFKIPIFKGELSVRANYKGTLSQLVTTQNIKML